MPSAQPIPLDQLPPAHQGSKEVTGVRHPRTSSTIPKNHRDRIGGGLAFSLVITLRCSVAEKALNGGGGGVHLIQATRSLSPFTNSLGTCGSTETSCSGVRAQGLELQTQVCGETLETEVRVGRMTWELPTASRGLWKRLKGAQERGWVSSHRRQLVKVWRPEPHKKVPPPADTQVKAPVRSGDLFRGEVPMLRQRPPPSQLAGLAHCWAQTVVNEFFFQ